MSRVPLIITIDGPAGVGKSTLAARTAQALDAACLDTGAMFRTVGLALAASGLELTDAGLVLDGAGSESAASASAAGAAPDWQALLAGLDFSLQGTGSGTRLLCNGRLVGDEVRSEEAGLLAARVARVPQVRAFLKAAQQKLGAEYSLVAEGRDMGSVVFPGALCKIFLDATPEIRADRRCAQLRAMGRDVNVRELAEQIKQRDELDRKRPVAPLKPAFDALCIDTSDKDVEAVFAAIMEAATDAISKLPPENPMRRKDRLWPLDRTLALLDTAEYGVLAVDDGQGWPYAVQLSFVRLDGVLYFHSAMEGRKVRALGRDRRVCFTVTGKTGPVYDGDFSTYFQSALVQGEALLLEDDEEKYRALYALAAKYLPEHMDRADHDIRRSFARTAVYRIAPRRISGKAKGAKSKSAGSESGNSKSAGSESGKV